MECNMDIKFDFNDIVIPPSETFTNINSRKFCNIYDDVFNNIPIFTAPMFDVVSLKNYQIFMDNNINPIIPRSKLNLSNFSEFIKHSSKMFVSVSLREFEDYILSDSYFDEFNKSNYIKFHVLIDIANGHMKKIYDLCSIAKIKYSDKIILMVGNIANPNIISNIYRENCVDYIRLGIGNGNACTTTQNVGVGYPMASLIYESYNILNKIDSVRYKRPKLIADGGMKSTSDIIKSLYLGADYVMVGSMFNKCLESSSNTSYIKNGTSQIIDQYSDESKLLFESGESIYKIYRGMSTKNIQSEIKNDNTKLTTSEGVIIKNIKVEYIISGWVENFSDYLKSTMSYVNSDNLMSFKGKPIFITNNAYTRFNK